MRNQVKIQKEWSQGSSIQQDTMHVLPKGGWGMGAVRTIGFQTSCSKCKSIAFYRSLGMRNQVETQKERCQGISIQRNSMHYFPRAGPWVGRYGEQ